MASFIYFNGSFLRAMRASPLQIFPFWTNASGPALDLWAGSDGLLQSSYKKRNAGLLTLESMGSKVRLLVAAAIGIERTAFKRRTFDPLICGIKSPVVRRGSNWD